MRAVIAWSLVILFGLVMVAGCGPSEEERAAAAAAEKAQQEQEAERQAKLAAAREATAAKLAARDEEATKAVNSWYEQMRSDPSVKPRKYDKALESMSVKSGTLTAAISLADTDEAQKLCNFLNVGWWDREKYGVGHVQVVLTLDGHVMDGRVLAKTVKLDTGAVTCK